MTIDRALLLFLLADLARHDRPGDPFWAPVVHTLITLGLASVWEYFSRRKP